MNTTTITNPFYERVRRGGIRIKIDRPAPAGVTITNPYYERAKHGVTIHTGRGRPKKSEGKRATATRSIRLTPAVWQRIEDQAAREGITVHAALRQAVLIWLRS